MNIITQNGFQPEAFTAEYDDYTDLINIEPISKPADYEVIRSHYKTMTMRERVEQNRRVEETKHQAYCNRLATKGQKMLEQAAKEATQPKQLSLF